MKRRYEELEELEELEAHVNNLVPDVLVGIFLQMPLAMRRWVIPAVCQDWRRIMVRHASMLLYRKEIKHNVASYHNRFTVCLNTSEDDIAYNHYATYESDRVLLPIKSNSLLKRPKLPRSEDRLLLYAASIGSLSLFQWGWYLTAYKNADFDLYEDKYIHFHRHQSILAKRAHLHILKWLENHQERSENSLFDVHVLDNLFASGNLEAIKWGATYFQDLAWPCETCAFNVIASGNREAITWAFAQNNWGHNFPGAITTMLSQAWVMALRGHGGQRINFDLLKWADEQKYEWKSHLIVPAAAGLGRTDIMEWAITRGCALNIKGSLLEACKYNRLNVLIWMDEHFTPEELKHDDGWDLPFSYAFRYGHADILSWIIKHKCEGKLPLAYVEADDGRYISQMTLATFNVTFGTQANLFCRVPTLKLCLYRALDYGKRSLVPLILTHPFFGPLREATLTDPIRIVYYHCIHFAYIRNLEWAARTYPLEQDPFIRYLIACKVITHYTKQVTAQIRVKKYTNDKKGQKLNAVLTQLNHLVSQLTEAKQFYWAATLGICISAWIDTWPTLLA